MKIAAVTDDGKTISQHFGRATQYAVITVEKGEIIERELREKMGHRQFSQPGRGRHRHQDHDHEHGEEHEHDHQQGHGFGRHSEEKHRLMFESILDCEILLARGMGRGAHLGLKQCGLKPILTDIANIDKAVKAIIDGSIKDLTDRLH